MLSVIDKTESESNQISIILVRIDYEAAHFKSLKLLKAKIGFHKIICIILKMWGDFFNSLSQQNLF